MKKNLLVAVLLLTLPLYLQAADPIRWGVVSGLNISHPDYQGAGTQYGFHAGVKAELGLPHVSKGLFLQSAATLSLKGMKKEMGEIDKDNVIHYWDQKVHDYWLEVPIHMGYKIACGKNFTVFGSAGPYAALGLFGKVKANYEGEKYSSNVFGSNHSFKRFDFGLGCKIGVEIYRKIQIGGGFDRGLIDIGHSADYKQTNYTVSCAYMF